VRCPKCNALAADSDPYCLWCEARLVHPKIVPTPPRRGGKPSYGWPDPNRKKFDSAGMGMAYAGMFVGSIVAAAITDGVAADAGANMAKAFIALGACCGLPLLGVWFLVRLLGRSR
jgi:hypothetical protein